MCSDPRSTPHRAGTSTTASTPTPTPEEHSTPGGDIHNRTHTHTHTRGALHTGRGHPAGLSGCVRVYKPGVARCTMAARVPPWVGMPGLGYAGSHRYHLMVIRVRRFARSLAVPFESPDYELRELMKKVADGRIQLPDFQREWKWDDDHISSLLASISMGHPIGVLMMLDVGGDIDFAAKPLAGVENGSIGDPERLLLDGQQRTTSLFQALYSERPAQMSDARKRLLARWYYIDIGRALEDPGDRDEAILSIPEDRVIRGNFGRQAHPPVVLVRCPRRDLQRAGRDFHTGTGSGQPMGVSSARSTAGRSRPYSPAIWNRSPTGSNTTERLQER